MNPDFAVEIIRVMIVKATQLASPILVIAMGVGMSVSVAQTVTSINEQTLTFFPKTLGIASFLIAAAPWMIRSLIEFTRWIFEMIPQMTA